MAAVTICSDFGAPKIKSATVSPSICHEVMGPDAMSLVFWMLSFKPTELLYNIVVVFAIHWHESAMGVHVSPILNPLPPPHPIPQGCPSAPALGALFHASNLDCWSISHMEIYTFQCFLSNNPTVTFSHRVQKSVLYICVSFAVSHIGSLLPSF